MALLSPLLDVEMRRIGIRPEGLSEYDRKYLLEASSRMWNGEVE